ncbi:MAG: thiamine phosphate synthase [Desulfarculus sp.]|nr:thiamine phosphate synthase [Desulfarculus sp.]
MPKAVGRLHVLTDQALQRRFSHLELARLAILGGADVIQFRQKGGSTRQMIETASAMRRLCEEMGAVLIVNDRLDVALAAKAHGAHLGQDDFPLPLARELLGPGAILGGSASSLEEARQCLAQGADYVGFGPVFATTSKDDAGPASGLGLLARVVQEIPLPVVAIGGIGPLNAPQVMATGVHGLAVISAVCCQEDPRAATQALRQAMASPAGGGHA